MIKIQGRIVTESDIGSPVTYTPNHANGDICHPDCERGHISSFNDDSIWVRYKAACGANTPPETLVWSSPEDKIFLCSGFIDNPGERHCAAHSKFHKGFVQASNGGKHCDKITLTCDSYKNIAVICRVPTAAEKAKLILLGKKIND